MKSSVNFLNHFAFWFVTVFATPLFIAINNPDDITFPLGMLALSLFGVCLALSIASLGITRLAGVKIAGRTGLLLAGAALVIAVQGNVIHDLFFYGNFNGEAVNFRRDIDSFWYEWYGFLAGLLIITALVQWRQPRGYWLGALPVLSSVLLLVPALLEYSADAPPVAVDDTVDPSVFGFSRNGNLVHLLPDGFQSDVVQQVLQENPDLAAHFEGFTLFANHLGMFQGTAPSVPTILTGTPFKLEDGHKFQKVMEQVHAEGYPNHLQQAGYRLDYALISGTYCAPGADSCVARPFNDMKARGYFRHRDADRNRAIGILADLSLFRMTPRFLKEKIYDKGHWFLSDTTLDGSSPWPDPVIREWTDNMHAVDGPPAFKYYHYIGTHIPPHWDAECNYQRDPGRSRESYLAQARCVLDGMARLIMKLKELDLYDQTAFVITGDHGHGTPPADAETPSQLSALPPSLMGSARPAFLIKEKNNREALVFSRLPTSLVDVAQTALALVDLQDPQGRTTVFELEAAPDRDRFFIPYSIRDLFSGNPVPHVIYRVGDDVRDGSQWVIHDIKPYITAPSSYTPVNYRNGQNLIHGLRFSVNQPDKEATWVNGRQLAFLISTPAGSEGPFDLKFAVHLPVWLEEQRMDIAINGTTVAEDTPIVMDKGYWVQVVIELDGVALKEENNFVSVEFARSYLPPAITHWEAAALMHSIRLVERPSSGTSTSVASPP